MKGKIYFFLVIFIFLTGILPAQAIPEANTEIPIKYEQSAQIITGFNTLQDYQPSCFSLSGSYNIWGKRFSAFGGFFLEGGDCQLTLKAAYKFFKREKLSLATGVIYNLDWLQNISLANNFLPCISFEWKPFSFYTLKTDLAFMFKLRRVFVFDKNTHPLINATMAAVIKNTFNLPRDINLYLEFASIENFRYMVFCAPSFIMGAQYKLNEKIELSLEAAIRYIDFFTLSAHYSDSDIRLGVKYKW